MEEVNYYMAWPISQGHHQTSFHQLHIKSGETIDRFQMTNSLGIETGLRFHFI